VPRRRRRETNIFSLSLLDCICCGLGALTLFHLIVASRSARIHNANAAQLQAEVDKRERLVLDGQAHLVEVRNSFREIEQKRAEAAGLSTRILETLRQIDEELAIYEAKTVAQKEHVNKLKADLKSLEEGQKRLSGGTKSDEVPGRNVRNFVGDGDRQYLTGLKVGGKRIFLLVDASASMLAEASTSTRMRLPPTFRPVRYWRSPSPTKLRTLPPGTSSLGVPPDRRFWPSSSDLRSAFSLFTCSFCATVFAS